jgi:hypothetical protein
MARGKDIHDAKLAAINRLGKSISRRAGSKCELCSGDLNLRVMEVGSTSDEPDEEAAILACESCRELVDAKKLDPANLRFLEGAVWSETIPVKVAVIGLLRRLAEQQVGWAQDCLDGVWIDEELEERLQS